MRMKVNIDSVDPVVDTVVDPVGPASLLLPDQDAFIEKSIFDEKKYFDPKEEKKQVPPPSPVRKKSKIMKSPSYLFPVKLPSRIDFGNGSAPIYVVGNTVEILSPPTNPMLDNLDGKTLFIAKEHLDDENSITIQFGQGFPSLCPAHYSIFIWVNNRPLPNAKDFYLAIGEQPVGTSEASKKTIEIARFRLCKKIDRVDKKFDPNIEQNMFVYEFEELISIAKTGTADREPRRPHYHTGTLLNVSGYNIGFRDKEVTVNHQINLKTICEILSLKKHHTHNRNDIDTDIAAEGGNETTETLLEL